MECGDISGTRSSVAELPDDSRERDICGMIARDYDDLADRGTRASLLSAATTPAITSRIAPKRHWRCYGGESRCRRPRSLPWFIRMECKRERYANEVYPPRT
jgi:hypothetical protein